LYLDLLWLFVFVIVIRVKVISMVEVTITFGMLSSPQILTFLGEESLGKIMDDLGGSSKRRLASGENG
jgi:hypothetical protein